MNENICYLDNAATSFPKPVSVAREIQKCISTYCGNAGRGSHRLSLFASNKIYECREAICSLINAPSPENIAFVPTCSYGLNLIIKGILAQGDHALISDMEHNSVWRPVERLKREGIITFDCFSALSKHDQSDDDILNDIKNKLRKNTKLLICTHQSNICSYSLPVAKIGELCKKNNILFALDVAQSIGHYNIDMQKMNVDYLAAPGHKGLYGPQGSAFIAVNSKRLLNTLIEGGNGIQSLSPDMPELLPERYEVGTLPLPSIVGLLEGIKEVKFRGIDEISKHECTLFRYLRDGLLNIKGVTVYAPAREGSTLLFNTQKYSSERVMQLLDKNNICVRGGFHCSSLAHHSLGTQKTGAIRASFGIFNTKKDIDKLLFAINS